MSVDELITRARDMTSGTEVPSKSSLQKTLRIGWDRANEIHRQLSAEVELAGRVRSTKRRAALTKVRRGKGLAGPVRLRPYRLLAAPDAPVAPVSPAAEITQVEPVVEGPQPAQVQPSPTPSGQPSKRAATWPVVLLALPAFVAIWSGWVDLGRLTGFGVVHPLPGIADEVALNTAITLPIGLETYAAYALYVWLSGAVPARARQFARRSAIGSLVLGAGGQVAYHLMVAAGMARAPWWITTVVACLPVAVLGMGAALRHLVHAEQAS